MTNQSANLEALRNFASAHHELAFAHMVTVAIQGEAWAIDRVMPALTEFSGAGDAQHHAQQAWEIIRATDTTRPDGVIAREILSP